MRMNNPRMKSNPFTALRDRRSKQQNRSIDGCQQIDTLQPSQKITSEERLTTKYRNKSFAKPKESRANLDIAANISFKDLGKQLKSKRTLVEENEQLKKKLETLMQNKSSRRGSTAKKLSTQFQKEIYWNGSQSYMISGIKLQYQKMKDSYIKKSQDYEDLLRSAAVANNMEFMAYIQALQVENHILAKQLEVSLAPKTNSDDQALLLQLKERISRYQSVLQQQKERNCKKGTQIKKLKSKISFLQKLVISKDSNEHLANRATKKLEKQRSDLLKRISGLEQRIQLMGRQHENKISRIQSFHKQNLELQLNRQASNSKQQHENISRLMRQNRYLQVLIESWKADRNPQKQTKQHKEPHKEHHTHTHTHHKDSTASKPKADKDYHRHSHIQTAIDNKSTLKKSTPKEQSQHHSISMIYQKHAHPKDESQSEQQQHRREPYSADNKNSEQSVKNRRVQLHQIEDIVQFYRIRLIAREKGIDWIIKQFQANQDDKWRKQYISMGEARHHLQKQLQIDPLKSLLIARYLIQHSNSEFVYTDDLNEYSRPVVKSIIKSLFNNYSIYSNEKAEFTQVLQTHRSKLEWMLESTTKGGVISRDKFNDLLQSLSINCKSGFDIFCIARMALKSQSLEKLQFKGLFEEMKVND